MEQKRKITWSGIIVVLALLIGLTTFLSTSKLFNHAQNVVRQNIENAKIDGPQFVEFNYDPFSGEKHYEQYQWVTTNEQATNGTWSVSANFTGNISIDQNGQVALDLALVTGTGYRYIVYYEIDGAKTSLTVELTVKPYGYAGVYGPQFWQIPYRTWKYTPPQYYVTEAALTNNGTWRVETEHSQYINIDPYSGELTLVRNNMVPGTYSYFVYYNADDIDEIKYQCSVEVVQGEMIVTPAVNVTSQRYNESSTIHFNCDVLDGTWKLSASNSAIKIDSNQNVTFPANLDLGTYSYQVTCSKVNYNDANYYGTFTVVKNQAVITGDSVINWVFNTNEVHQYTANTASNTTNVWSVQNGPNGITIDSNGKLAITSSLSVGTYDLTIVCDNAQYDIPAFSVKIIVKPGTLAFTQNSNFTFSYTFNQNFTYQYNLTYQPVGTTTWKISNTTDFSISQTGQLTSNSKTVNVGKYPFTLTLTNSNYATLVKSGTIEVLSGTIALTGATSISKTFGDAREEAYSSNVAGSQPTTWTFSATDSKITFDQNTKKVKIDYLINNGNYSYTISVKNANYQTVTKTVPVSVVKGSIKITSTDWNLSYTYNRPVGTNGGAPDAKTITHSAYGSTTIALNSTNLASSQIGLNANGKFQVVSNLHPGSYYFSVKLTNTNYNTTEKTYSFTVYKETTNVRIRWTNRNPNTWWLKIEWYSKVENGYFHFEVLDGLGREISVWHNNYGSIGFMYYHWVSTGDRDLNFGYDSSCGRYKCWWDDIYFELWRDYWYFFDIGINEGADYNGYYGRFNVNADDENDDIHS